MAREHAFQCDVSGKLLAEEFVPLIVRISVALVPGAARNPVREDLSPLLQQLLFAPDGAPRQGPNHGVLELSAVEFDACFIPDLERLAAAFEPKETPTQELARLRATVARLQAVDTGGPG